MFTPSVRGNLLDLAHVWHAADGPDSRFDPVPAHLKLIWHTLPPPPASTYLESELQPQSPQASQPAKLALPYWLGATLADQEAMQHFRQEVTALLARQGVRLGWRGPSHILPEQAGLSSTTSDPPPPRYENAAFTLLTIPAGLKPRRPRYDHSSHLLTTTTSQKAGERANHPPVKVRWPRSGQPTALQDFLLEALIAEGIAAWPYPPYATPLADLAHSLPTKPIAIVPGPKAVMALAVATAPWFTTADPAAITHMAVAIAKLDFYLFAH